MAYNVLIVEDHSMVRQLFSHIVSSDSRYHVAAAIDTAMYADTWCAKGGIDLIIMDVVMQDASNGLDAAARIKATYPKIKIIIVTSMPDPLILKRAREIGVDSFWYKEAEEEPLLRVMDCTMAGLSVWPFKPPEANLGKAKSTDLTEKEIAVLRLVAEGLTDREISERLIMSVPAIRYYVGNLIAKTGCASRTELAVCAVRSGLTIPQII